MKTRSSLKYINNIAFISQIKPKNIKETKNDPNWINAIQEELNQFKRINVWTLVERPYDNNIIRTKLKINWMNIVL